MLSGIKVTSLTTAKEACNILHSMGPRICILKGLQLMDKNSRNKEGEKCLSIVLSVAEEDDNDAILLRIDVPKLEGKFSGCGDLFTAMCGGRHFSQNIELYCTDTAPHCTNIILIIA